MSILSRAVDLITFRDLPANQPTRRYQPAIETRSSLSASIPGWHSGRPTWPSDNVIVMTRDGYRKCVTAFACINVIADAVAEATLRVWDDKGSGQRDELIDHPLRRLMQRPHPSRSESEFLTLTVRIAAITGYCVIEKVRSARGNVVQLGHLRPDYLQPIPRDQRAPDWEYTIPGQAPVVLKAEDAVVYTYMDAPFLDLTGDTPMRAILREAGILNDLTAFVKLTLERGGMPQIVLVEDMGSDPQGVPPERLTPEEREVVREAFIQKYGGYQNWSGPAVIGGFKVERLGFNMNEMAFTDLRDGIDVEVCRAFRVPPPVVQVMAGLNTSYGQTLRESMTLLQQYTANPLRARLDGALTRSLMPEFDSRPTVSLEFDTTSVDALQEDEDAVHQRAREDLKAGGITLDQFLRRIGEDPLENDLGSSLLMPFSVVPTHVDTPVVAVVPVVDPEPDPEPDPDDEEGGDARFVEREGRRYLDTRKLSPLALDRRATATSMIRLQQTRLADLLRPKVTRFLDDQRARLVDAVVGSARSLDDRLSPDERMLFAGVDDNGRFVRFRSEPFAKRVVEDVDWDGEDAALATILAAWWPVVGETAFESAEAQLGDDLGWSTGLFAAQIARSLESRTRAINATTRRDIEELVIAALLAGRSLDELRTDLEHLYDTTYAGRDSTIATTETTVAFAQASVLAFMASGVQYVEVIDNVAHTEAYPGAADGLTCAQRSGIVVPIARGMFHVESDHPNGSAALLPVKVSA